MVVALGGERGKLSKTLELELGGWVIVGMLWVTITKDLLIVVDPGDHEIPLCYIV